MNYPLSRLLLKAAQSLLTDDFQTFLFFSPFSLRTFLLCLSRKTGCDVEDYSLRSAEWIRYFHSFLSCCLWPGLHICFLDVCLGSMFLLSCSDLVKGLSY